MKPFCECRKGREREKERFVWTNPVRIEFEKIPLNDFSFDRIVSLTTGRQLSKNARVVYVIGEPKFGVRADGKMNTINLRKDLRMSSEAL